MTPEEEWFGAALMLARRHGQAATFVAAARIEEFLQADEAEAVTLWEEIAQRIPLALERIAARPS
jgi:hypothetical protein